MRPEEDPVTSASPPLVSIGMPVFNEARFVDASLASLRQQDYPRFEILISDNASTDDTIAICERHAAQDDRIRIRRQTANLGATSNFEETLSMAAGSYFMWAAGHDLWSPDFVSECVALLERQPGACLAFGCSQWIGPDGLQLAKTSGWTDTRGMHAAGRLFTILWGNMHPIMGLLRTAELRACMPFKNVAGGDLVILSQLALRGDFVHAPSAEWRRREIHHEANHDAKLRRYAQPSVAIVKSPLATRFPMMQLPLELIATVWRSNLPMRDRLGILMALIPMLPLRYVMGKRS